MFQFCWHFYSFFQNVLFWSLVTSNLEPNFFLIHFGFSLFLKTKMAYRNRCDLVLLALDRKVVCARPNTRLPISNVLTFVLIFCSRFACLALWLASAVLSTASFATIHTFKYWIGFTVRFSNVFRELTTEHEKVNTEHKEFNPQEVIHTNGGQPNCP